MSDERERPIAEDRRPEIDFDSEQVVQQPPVRENIPRKVMVIPVENGFIVEIGCKRFVADTWDRASVGLGLYFQDPQAAEEKYCKK